MPSPFDFDSFAQTAVDATQIDYEFHVIPEGSQGQAQIIDLAGQDLSEYADKFQNRPVISLALTWEIQDENLRQELNMDSIRVPQKMILELTAPHDQGGVIDFGTNKNQQLKDVIKAVGLDDSKKFSLPMLKHQVGWVAGIKHRTAPDGRVFAEVQRVTDVARGRAAWEAAQA